MRKSKKEPPLSPELVKFIHFLADAAVRHSMREAARKKGNGSDSSSGDPQSKPSRAVPDNPILPPPKGGSAPPAPLALDIKAAAAVVGLSRAQFYRLYINSGRVRAIKTGARDRVIDYEELQAAYKKLRAELPRAGRQN